MNKNAGKDRGVKQILTKQDVETIFTKATAKITEAIYGETVSICSNLRLSALRIDHLLVHWEIRPRLSNT